MRVVVHGGGRMARQVANVIDEAGHSLLALVSRNRPDWLTGVDYHESLDALSELPDAVIDFTLSGGTSQAADWCRARLVALVSGTTALVEDDRESLRRASELVPVLWAPNLARGPNLLMRTVHETAHALGDSASVEVLDIHHFEKKDAPSGTALLLAQAIASAWQVPLDDVLDLGETARSEPRAGRISCISRREGDVIGQHRVTFKTAEDTLVLSHDAADRSIYARGSIEAAQWLTQQPAGLYTGADWLSQ
ncbi:MAG: 4-hydroxy-tetrahydrodipicolinate reductase [Xanthomonadales bacterium]|nr:4-hydroxy-tetrahydrodipicolinate reductase [Gammaproteobacteria bacterium]NNE05421.1 4-hydroxy-tetrahydrodipicolinate reductase [Xanthomonadales bacterium]NNL95785.1 4-hydroxy-tetrahydrodipicolinate reductase [Xanthomonadales bacterium]